MTHRSPLARTAALLSLALLAACGGGGGGSSTPPTTTPNTVFGVVTDAGTGGRLAGVAVAAGARTTTTDDAGEFTLTGVPAGAVKLTLTLDGYAPTYGLARSGEDAEAALVALKREGARQAYDPAQAATLSELTEAGPYALILSPDSLDTTATGLEVTITPVDPTRERSVLPGQLVTAGDNGSVLVPVTFAEFSLYEPGGRRVNLKSSASAVVELPIPPSLRAQYPLGTVIHCYAYGPDSGAWQDFVEGTVSRSSVDGVTPVLRAAIRHFSWYGAAPEGNDCADLYGKVVSAVDGKPLPNARVEAFPGTATYSDANGDFQLVALRDGSSEIVAYQTGIDVDGSLTGMPGAKYIEFGKVADLPLTGLVSRSCSGGAGLSASVAGDPAGLAAVVGTPEDRLVIRVGVLSQLAYHVVGVLDAAGGFVSVEEGLPGPDGDLLDPVPTDTAVVTLTGPDGQPHVLPLAAAETGFYTLQAALTPGERYDLAVDVNGDGAVDGAGWVEVVGELAWESPADGATVGGSGLTARWTDSATAGHPGYAPLYWATLSSDADAAFYWGTDRTFAPTSLLDEGSPLSPGAYTGSVLSFSGPFSADPNVQMVPNVTGATVSGFLYSFASATEVTFTVQ
ncbi:MAG: carboxypeptidase regulatory-like domain-containing protein [Anaeromyxobacter sp.]